MDHRWKLHSLAFSFAFRYKHGVSVHNRVEPKLAKWPFIVGDVLLLCVAALIAYQNRAPLGLWQTVVCSSVVGLGALLCVTPFVLEYRATVRLTEAEALLTSAAQMKNLEQVTAQISAATGQWQIVQEHSTSTVNAAKQISERMAAEVTAFTEFLQKANDSERATLRLEVEKLRRAEGDWLQVVVRMLDHVFALHRAAARSGQRAVTEQISSFQNACRDIARRVGLVPFEATPGQPFDAAKHKLVDSGTTPPAGALVAETIAVGYKYQNQALRPALVTLQPGNAGATEDSPKPDTASDQSATEPTLL
jgi:molecular chaperone GrpE (heat shock protein)